MSIADAMASNGMKELGYEYINLDGEPLKFWHLIKRCSAADCWADKRDQDGAIVPDKQRFPE